MTDSSSLKIAFMNIYGQSNIPTSKQLQIQDFLKLHKIDILHMQEVNNESNTFEFCDFISSQYNIIPNNSISQYGTSSIFKNSLEISNTWCDTSGRAILFNIGSISFGNFYAPSGTDGATRATRESFFSEVIPNLLINSQSTGLYGGDFNSIIEKQDATVHQQAKMSPSFKRLAKTFNWVDSFRVLHPTATQFSRYYSNTRGDGATRIDRSYHCGNIEVKQARYLPIALFDTVSLINSICLYDPG